MRLAKYYKSDIIGLYIGGFPAIVVQAHEHVVSLLNNPDFDGRGDVILIRMRDPESQLRGIFFTDGPFWKEQRRFFLRHLRDYGFGRRFSNLEIETRDEICQFLDMVRGGPQHHHEQEIVRGSSGSFEISVPEAFAGVMANTFLSVICGTKLPRSEMGSLLE